MIQVLKYTYLMDVDKIEEELEKLWGRYQDILDNPNWLDLNEARSILYIIGHVYCEKIAPGAIERRLHLLKNELTLLEFFSLIDSESNLKEYRKDELFVTLENFYRLIKKYKNRFVGGKFYLDEEKFMELYNKYNPDKEFKMRERGKFDRS